VMAMSRGERRERRRRAGRRLRTGLAVAIGILVAPALTSGMPHREGARGRHVGGKASIAVAPGDTLWELAERHAPPRVDVRQAVAQMAELNGLSGATIRPGQLLFLPDWSQLP